MSTIILAIFILTEIIYYLIIFHIILSWLAVFGIQIKFKFIDDLITPIYKNIKKVIPTTIGPFDFTPIVLLFILILIKVIISIIFPEYSNLAINILNP